jgi:hypothetical protein
MLPKPRRSVTELFFALVAVSTLFLITVHQMSMDGILPGNDPAVHLDKAKTIVASKGVVYSWIPWYPPLFHSFLAVLLLLVGTVDVVVAGLVMKFVVATINVLILLSTYLLGRRLLGRGVAVASAVFTILSVPLFEMIFWGGYANFLGLAYIALIFYIMNMNYGASVKTFLLFLVTFALVLTHQLASFVFLLVFVPAFLIGTTRSKRKFLAFLAVVLGSVLAILAWYAEVIFHYSSVFVYHLFFGMKEYFYSIPYVSLDSLTERFGVTLFLAVAGIPLTFVLLKRRKALSASSLLILWIAVPFFFSQSYVFGLYVPYERFIYLFITPLAIFAGALAYSLTKLPPFIASKLLSKTGKKRKMLRIGEVSTLTILVLFFSLQGFLFLESLEGLPQYYEVAGIAGFNAGKWLKQYSVSDSVVVVSEIPGTWFHVVSDHETIEEINPLYGRNVIAEAALCLFYEMENTRTLTREYTPGDPISGQVMYVSIYNAWTKTLSIPDESVYVNCSGTNGEEVLIPLSETAKRIYWKQRSVEESQLVSEYSHDLFTLEKVVTLCSESSVINFEWKFTACQDLAAVELKVFSFTEPSLDFREAFLPGVLDWQNPWDKPSFNMGDDWALVECPPYSLSGSVVAILDAENGVLIVSEFDDFPEWVNVGALGNRFIDALRVGYEFGDLTKGGSREFSFSVLSCSLESRDIEQWSQDALKQLLDSKTNWSVQERDFLTYIKEYNIKSVVIDSQRIFLNVESSPVLNRVYDNNRFVIFAIRWKHVTYDTNLTSISECAYNLYGNELER